MHGHMDVRFTLLSEFCMWHYDFENIITEGRYVEVGAILSVADRK